MLKKISNDVTDLKDGLDPKNLAFWYDKIIKEYLYIKNNYLNSINCE